MKAIVVSFDHLPVGFLGLHGNTWVDTPAFDRLAAEGVVFDRHLAERVGESEARSHAWWTGSRTPSGSGVGAAGRTIAQRLEAAGVRTALIVEGPGDAKRVTPMPEGFGEVHEVAGAEGLEAVPAETPFSRVVLHAAEWLAEPPAGDWLLWVKSRGVPSPWVPPREFAERYVPLFEELEDEPDWEAESADDDEFEWIVPGEDLEEDQEGALVGEGGLESEFVEPIEVDEAEEVEAAADWLDEAEEFDELLVMLGSVGLREGALRIDTSDWLLVRAVYGGYVALLDEGLAALRRAIQESVGEDVLLIVTGGEGESLGERAELPSDWAALGEEVVHTPLLVAAPRVQAGSRRGDLVQSTDVGPTLLEWFGVDVAGAECDGRSLLPMARGAAQGGHEELVVRRETGMVGLRQQDWYLVAQRPTENSSGDGDRWLFAKPEDVWDLQDVASQEPERSEALAARLRTLVWEESAESAERNA